MGTTIQDGGKRDCGHVPKNGEIVKKEMIKWEIKLKLADYVSICRASSTYEAPMNYPGEYWIQKVGGTSENWGKELRWDGFGLAEELYSRLC